MNLLASALMLKRGKAKSRWWFDSTLRCTGWPLCWANQRRMRGEHIRVRTGTPASDLSREEYTK